MASLGNSIKHSFEKKTISSTALGVLMSTFTTVAPMFFIIGGILFLYRILDYSSVIYSQRVLFSCSILYIFIFSLLCTAPFNSVISRYITDRIFEEKYDAILPCFYGGLFLNLTVCCLLGIPFYIYAHFVGKISLLYVFICFMAFIALSLTFYSMLYLFDNKRLRKNLPFLCDRCDYNGAFLSFVCKVLHLSVTVGMLLSLTFAFWVIAVCEFSYVKGYFHNSNRRYFDFMQYFKKYWQLGRQTLSIHLHSTLTTLSFWTKNRPYRGTKTYICYPPYDMATCIAMLTNISASVILITQIELHFHERYKAYSESVIGGRLRDIIKSKEPNVFSFILSIDGCCPKPVYHFRYPLSDLCCLSTTIRICGYRYGNLSLSGCRIFRDLSFIFLHHFPILL